MDRCSYFIKNKALFGGFPTQESVEELESNGVRCFVDLCYSDETKITPYTTNYNYINFPIPDRRIPTDWAGFAKFIVKISKIINDLPTGEKLYLHCKGGHGRSGIVVACVLCYMDGITPHKALELTAIYHNNRSVMRDKWRKIGAPQTKYQKIFVHRLFEPLNFYRAYKTGHTCGFSNFSLHPVEVDGIGTFPTSEAAWQACKDPENNGYVYAQLMSRSPGLSKYMGRRCNLRKDWGDIKISKMIEILLLKFDQHPSIKQNLLNTGFRPLVEHTVNDSYWGDGGDGTGINMLGRILTGIRNKYYRDEEHI